MTDLDELERLLREATAGPWELDCAIHDSERMAVKYVSEHGMTFYIAEEVGGRRKGENFHDKSELVANAALIAALRNHAEELIRDARRYRFVRMNRLWLKANLPMIAAPAFDEAIDAAIAQEQP